MVIRYFAKHRNEIRGTACPSMFNLEMFLRSATVGQASRPTYNTRSYALCWCENNKKQNCINHHHDSAFGGEAELVNLVNPKKQSIKYHEINRIKY